MVALCSDKCIGLSGQDRVVVNLQFSSLLVLVHAEVDLVGVDVPMEGLLQLHLVKCTRCSPQNVQQFRLLEVLLITVHSVLYF